MSVVALEPKPHVLIESGRVTKSDDPAEVGRWFYFVSFHDGEGIITDYIGPDYAEAGRAAIEWARDCGCKIVDRSKEERRR